jgi:hypothetical protein
MVFLGPEPGWLLKVPLPAGAKHFQSQAETAEFLPSPEIDPEFLTETLEAATHPGQSVFVAVIGAVGQRRRDRHAQFGLHAALSDRAKMMQKSASGNPQAKTRVPGTTEKIVIFIPCEANPRIKQADFVEYAPMNHKR